MTSVRPFEADLLHLLHAILGRAPVARALVLLDSHRPKPKCLTGPALRLIESTLARGCVHRLARRDGWHRERHLRDDRVVEGRLWDRTTLDHLALTFTGHSLEVLIRLLADAPKDWPLREKPTADVLSLGDAILFYFAYDTFRSTKVGEALRKMPCFRWHGLCRLTFPADFAGDPDAREPDLASWAEPPRAWVLEVLQGTFAEAWLAAERAKRQIASPARVVAIGQQQERVTTAYLAAIDAAGRRDLARFLLRVARELLRDGTGLESWAGHLETQGLRLADRADAYRATLAPLGVLGRLHGWDREARGVGFFDEGYAAAQLWKTDWELFGGGDLSAEARTLFRAADPLAAGT